MLTLPLSFRFAPSRRGPGGWTAWLLLCLGAAAPLGAQVPLQPLRDVQQIAAGGSHTCALTTGGGVKCWGSNFSGQLGDGTTTNRYTPVDVPGLTQGVTAVSAGGSHTCALTSGGGVKCWGFNGYGQIGNGQGAFGQYQPTPVDVVGLGSGVAAISASGLHTCALTTAGGVKCWGRNASGQLGDGSTMQRLTPVNVSGLSSGVTAISAGGTDPYGHTCALTVDGQVKCWGNNSRGQLGDGTLTNQPIPVDVAGLGSAAAAVATADRHSCVLTTAGGVLCWGTNAYFALGDPNFSANYSTVPMNLAYLGNSVAAISASGSYDHTCVLILSLGGRMMCWGTLYFPVGGVFPVFTFGPADQGLQGLTQIGSGGSQLASHVCAVTAEGGVKCRGGNHRGQLGNGETATYVGTPVDVLVAPPPVVLSISIERLPDFKAGAKTGADTRSYLVSVSNDGSETAHTVQLNVPAPGGLAGVSWSCAAPGAGGCSQAQGEGAVLASFDLGSGATAWVELQGAVAPGAAFVNLHAQSTTASGGGAFASRSYSESANGIGVMKDGFED